MKNIIMGICLLVIASSLSAGESPVPDQTKTYKTVADQNDELTELKLHIFIPPNHLPSDRRPAIVFFFGGGWNGGTSSQFYPHCEYLASRGMFAMSAEYRVKSRNNTTPRVCLQDGKSAIRWIRKHALELGIDPNRLVAGGGSAGGIGRSKLAAKVEQNLGVPVTARNWNTVKKLMSLVKQ